MGIASLYVLLVCLSVAVLGLGSRSATGESRSCRYRTGWFSLVGLGIAGLVAKAWIHTQLQGMFDNVLWKDRLVNFTGLWLGDYSVFSAGTAVSFGAAVMFGFADRHGTMPGSLHTAPIPNGVLAMCGLQSLLMFVTLILNPMGPYSLDFRADYVACGMHATYRYAASALFLAALFLCIWGLVKFRFRVISKDDRNAMWISLGCVVVLAASVWMGTNTSEALRGPPLCHEGGSRR